MTSAPSHWVRPWLCNVLVLMAGLAVGSQLAACYDDWECGERCMVGGACVEGECVCGPDLAECYGDTVDVECVDQRADPLNCGSCGRACAEGRACVGGRCEPCADGQSECGVLGLRPVCVDPARDTAHCGGCANTCPSGVDCIDGECTLVCEEGLDFCLSAAACVDRQTDDAHCGACDLACPEQTMCTGGACECVESDLAVCAGACVDTGNDVAHCGACDVACPDGERCVDGLCLCQEGQLRCEGSCREVAADPLNCGACDRACGRDFVCVQSTCLCVEPATACGDVCLDVDASAEFCGNCDTSCDPGEACADGDCTAVAQLGAGVANACATLVDGRVMCWGRNASGQCARAPSEVPVLRPSIARLIGGEVDVTALGDRHGCARKVDGTVWCWGNGAFGQLGDGRMDTAGAPAPVPDLADVADIAAGDDHTCVRKTDGSVLCWGLGRAGQIPGGRDVVAVPTVLDLVEPARSIHLGPATTCVLVTDARPGCAGELALAPIPAQKPKVASMAPGTSHGCLLYEGGAVACWGANDAGQGGVEGFDELPTVADVDGVGAATAVVVGDAFSCALLEADAGVACWGSNARGQLAQRDLAQSHTPLTIALPVTTQRLAAGPDFVCALGADGVTRCWGAGDQGQLGRGELTDRGEPSGVGW